MANDNLTAREKAKLADFVRKDLDASQPSASGATGAAADELGSDLKKNEEGRRKQLNTMTPSVKDDREVIKKAEAAGKHAPNVEEDVDFFSRGDVSKVVDELKAEKVEERQRVAAKKAQLPFVRLIGYPISPEVLAIIPREVAERYGIIAYIKAGRKVRLGVLRPGTKETVQALDSLGRATPFDFLIAGIGEDSYRYAMQLYEELPQAVKSASDVSVGAADKQAFETDIKSFLDLKAKITNVPTTKVVDTLLSGAVKVGASDVHIEPVEDGVRIRYRMDGVLHTVADFKADILASLLSRLKFLGKLKLDVNRMPQDGRFTIKEGGADGSGADGAEDSGLSGAAQGGSDTKFGSRKAGAKAHEIDVRVATMPSQYGEAITMRLLSRDSVTIGLDSLGLTGEARKTVLAAIGKPQGLVLECGPTGSGKTTTLYSLLTRLNDPEKKLVTLEDPVEYRLPGVIQSQIDPEHGYDFGEGFRSVLRLDPDVLMIGEIRDRKTADQAVQAALTGHIVLSTLHTNDAPTAIPRLSDLGVRPFLLANAINAVIAQRLVRKVCPHCAVETKPDDTAMEAVRKALKGLPPTAKDSLPPEKEWLFMKGKGCTRCNGTGYSGRIGIFEVLTINEELERMAMNHVPVSQIRQAARQAGMMTLEQDGLLKALAGVTTVDEVWRVARDI
ncbi:MAG: GspE/PulE family protein [bacterium]|nr:GspE/PulE family protein [bacterium]MDZ4247811.1 GspE/PulE family protein [Patescibacteria group bacterium]